MKKLFALIVVLLMCGYGFAQNTAVVTQTGDNQDANVGQTGSGNISTVYQLTDNSGVNQSDVIQSGISNQAYVEQYETGGGGNTPGTIAFIKQIGNYNLGYQYMNAPGFNSGQSQSAEQYGHYNYVNQRVDAGYNISQNSYQNGNNNISQQYSTSSQGYQSSSIQTWGNSSEAYQTAIGTKANLHITQYGGDDNYANQNFSGAFGFVAGNTGDITQNGYYNTGYQTLVGMEDNDLDLTQAGNWNTSTQYTDGDINTSSVYQAGNSNIGYINQAGDSNNASITSVGNGHNGSITQTGGMNDAVITQNP